MKPLNRRAGWSLLTAAVLALSACQTTAGGGSLVQEPATANPILEAKLRLFGREFCQYEDRQAKSYDRAVETPETKAIAAAFRDYVSAGEREDGAEIATLVTPETHDLFAQLARKALTADREELKSMPYALRFWTLSLRQDFPVAALQRMSGRELVEAAGALGWFSSDRRLSNRLRHYFINDRFAVAYLDLSCGEVDDFGVSFEQVQGEWRVDLVRTMRKYGIYLNHLVSRLGISEDALLMKMLETQSKRPVSPDIWIAPESGTSPDDPVRGA